MKRINKAVARKLYESGTNVYFIPCKIDPENSYGLGVWQNRNDPHKAFLNGNYDNFDTYVYWFERYNCYSDRGQYAAFYIEG